MSYQVLARKWRPSTFAAMVGQDHVLQALVNALDSNRLHHAYLFTGTRGVGKTSIARLFAKALNCEAGVSSKPCGQCSSCREISEGRFIDLIEVDAASRTKVEDTRELMENVQYAPTQGRYKVYLIDEVHMLSTHSFNALLKTLEEPPPHVKFLLATTDPQKLPVTILSRCLQFNLKNMVPEKIVDHLKQVMQAEQVPFEENALWLLARSANGSMRDAMSLSDQGIAFGSGKLLEVDVRAMLGSVDQRQVLALLSQLAQGSAAGLLNTVAEMAQFGADSDSILAELLGLLHRVGIAQMLPDAVDNSQGDLAAVLELAAQLRAEDVQLFYQIAINGRRDLPHVPVAREGLEMTLLRMLAFRPVGAGELALPEPTQQTVTDLPQQPAPQTQQQSMPSPADAASIVLQSQPETTAAPASAATSAYTSVPPDYDDLPPWGDVESAGGTGAAKKPEAPAALEPDAESITAPLTEPLSGQVARAIVEPQVEQRAEPDTQRSVASTTGPADFSQAAGQRPEYATAANAEQSIKPVVQPSTEAESQPDQAPTTAAAEAATTLGQTDDTPSSPAPAIEVTSGGEMAVRWVGLIDQIGLSGMTYNIAANALLCSIEDKCWCFTLPGEQIHLFNATHQQRLAQALSEHLGETVSVAVVEAAAEGETPAQYQERKRQERLAQAIEAIESDPDVQAIIATYDARIDPDSIKPIDNGELQR